METLAYAASTDYIRNLVEESKKVGWAVMLNLEEGTLLIRDTERKVEIFRALQMGRGGRWCLRGNPAYYTKDETNGQTNREKG